MLSNGNYVSSRLDCYSYFCICSARDQVHKCNTHYNLYYQIANDRWGPLYYLEKKIFFSIHDTGFKKLAALGGVFFLHWISYAYAVKLGGPSIGVLGLSTYGLQLVLASSIFLGHRMSTVELLSLILCMIGVVLIVPSWRISDQVTIGILLALFSATCFAMIPILHKSAQEYSQETRIFFQFFGSFILFLFFLPNADWRRLDFIDWSLLLYLGVFGTLIAHSLWAHITAKISPVVAGISYYAIAPITLVLSHFLIKERFNTKQIIGSMIVISSAIISTYMKKNMNEKKLLIKFPQKNLPELKLIRDVSKHLKRGHRWIFSDCFDKNERIQTGLAILKLKNEPLAIGLVQADTQLRFRLLSLFEESFVKPNNLESSLYQWSEFQWKKAVALRKNFVGELTNSFRLINGEGDGMPGLIIDIYSDTAVIKHDHEVAENFWNHQGIAQKIVEDFPQINCVYWKRRNDDEVKGKDILGALKEEVIFKENGCLFASNIRDAAKTGFFLDQRDNRKLISLFSKDKSLLNLFSYTGGFSVFGAIGGAREVTSVDIAKAATLAASRNFEVNQLKTKHQAIAEDAFVFIDQQIKEKRKWDIVITDPPSFAPNQKSLDTAKEAYIKVFSQSLKLVHSQGLFAASSCSSHVNSDLFFNICQESFSRNRKRGTLVYYGGQPFDHPYPMAMEELRYLKFALFRID